jgi:hypothetical protein
LDSTHRLNRTKEIALTAPTLEQITATATDGLKVTDRCDRCSAQALVRVEIANGGLELLFCGHHYSEKQDALASVAVVTHDLRGTINVKPSPSANAD